MWNGFESKSFTFAQRNAKVIYPKENINGRILFKTEYLDAFPNFDTAMLERGYHLIFIEHRTRWASDEEINIMADFVRYAAKELGASEKCLLEGMSCGGLQAARFAESYPELTSVMYLDAPVMNLLSMAGLGECKDSGVSCFYREICNTFGVGSSTIVNLRKSAIDNMEPLIKNNIPVIMLYGNADDCVIYTENGKVLEDYYTQNGGTIKVIAKSMCGHHPHGLDDPAPIIEFVESNWH